MQYEQVLAWLRVTDTDRTHHLFDLASDMARSTVGEAVHLRGLVEISSACRRMCAYCGLEASSTSVMRYRMSADEIIACAHRAVELGCGTLVLQSGEDPGRPAVEIARIIQRAKQETGLAVTLSLGEWSEAEYALWREAGADRYLMRFETSDPELYHMVHPDYAGHPSNRMDLLKMLRRLGYEAGGGFMVGLPGQSYERLAVDILECARLSLDMIGVGPFILHENTALGRQPDHPAWRLSARLGGRQVAPTAFNTWKTLALLRLVCPYANIPAATALAAVDPDAGREMALRCGANVMMLNLTPARYREDYAIYPGKVSAAGDPDGPADMALRMLQRLKRPTSSGPGASEAYRRRQEEDERRHARHDPIQ